MHRRLERRRRPFPACVCVSGAREVRGVRTGSLSGQVFLSRAGVVAFPSPVSEWLKIGDPSSSQASTSLACADVQKLRPRKVLRPRTAPSRPRHRPQHRARAQPPPTPLRIAHTALFTIFLCAACSKVPPPPPPPPTTTTPTRAPAPAPVPAPAFEG